MRYRDPYAARKPAKLTIQQRMDLYEVIRVLKVGPCDLRDSDPFGPRGEGAAAMRTYLRDGFKLWRDTWIVPHLESMLGETVKVPE